jgi:hypothetical protein
MIVLFQLKGEHREIVFLNQFRIIRAAISLYANSGWYAILRAFAVLLRPASLDVWEG